MCSSLVSVITIIQDHYLHIHSNEKNYNISASATVANFRHFFAKSPRFQPKMSNRIRYLSFFHLFYFFLLTKNEIDSDGPFSVKSFVELAVRQ